MVDHRAASRILEHRSQPPKAGRLPQRKVESSTKTKAVAESGHSGSLCSQERTVLLALTLLQYHTLHQESDIKRMYLLGILRWCLFVPTQGSAITVSRRTACGRFPRLAEEKLSTDPHGASPRRNVDSRGQHWSAVGPSATPDTARPDPRGEALQGSRRGPIA